MELIKKTYVCKNCEHKSILLNVIKDNRSLASDFTEDRLVGLGEVEPLKIYSYEVVRDDVGIVLYRQPIKCVCEKCASENIEYIPDQRYDNVLNYYPICENEKWYRGFEGLGQGR